MRLQCADVGRPPVREKPCMSLLSKKSHSVVCMCHTLVSGLGEGHSWKRGLNWGHFSWQCGFGAVVNKEVAPVVTEVRTTGFRVFIPRMKVSMHSCGGFETGAGHIQLPSCCSGRQGPQRRVSGRHSLFQGFRGDMAHHCLRKMLSFFFLCRDCL